MTNLALSTESISTLNSESEEDQEIYHDRSAAGSFMSIGSVDSLSSQHAANFDHDAATSIYDSLVEGHESANIQLELTSLRMSMNASEHQVRRAVVAAFMKRVSQVIKSGVGAKQAVAQVFGQHKELLERTMFDKNKSSKVDQVDFLLLMQSDLVHRESGDSILLHASMKLYEMDVFESEAFEQWWTDVKSSEDDGMKRVREKTQPFIDYLGNQSEEDEDEDDEEGADSDSE